LSVTKLKNLHSKDFIHSATASQSGQSSYDPYDFSNGDEERVTPRNLGEKSPGRMDRPARVLTAARLNWNSPPESPKYWGQVNPNLDH